MAVSSVSIHVVSPTGTSCSAAPNPGQKKLDRQVEENPEHWINDSLTNLESVTKEVRALVETAIEGWKEAEFGPAEGFQDNWSGIIALSVDGVPFMGELPGKSGQWICAGYH
jgi:glycine/D-amino acid oxidase-like deaminating enzyme